MADADERYPMQMWCVTITSRSIAIVSRPKTVTTTYAVMADRQQDAEEQAVREYGARYETVTSKLWGGTVVEFSRRMT